MIPAGNSNRQDQTRPDRGTEIRAQQAQAAPQRVPGQETQGRDDAQGPKPVGGLDRQEPRHEHGAAPDEAEEMGQGLGVGDPCMAYIPGTLDPWLTWPCIYVTMPDGDSSTSFDAAQDRPFGAAPLDHARGRQGRLLGMTGDE